MSNVTTRLAAVGLMLTLAACSTGSASEYESGQASRQQPACDPDNGGIELPDGFCALVVADSLGRARHLTVAENGDVYVALRQPQDGGGIVALRDTDGDGRADVVERFGEVGGTGIALHDGFLYFAPDTAVLRYPLANNSLRPTGAYEVVASGLPRGPSHAAKPFTFDDAGWMYVNIGAPSNACQEQDRVPGSPAPDPCPILEEHGGIWRLRATETGQTFEDAQQYATGIRNAVALDWNSEVDRLYALQHGRDMLHNLFPEMYTVQQSAELPAEEFFSIEQGDDFGWPYCYYDQQQNEKVLAPEYGGDGQMVGRCEQFEDPIVAFPGHYAPNDVVFYENATAFPEKYRDGAFIAFHGSWNRAPEPQKGFMVAFVPFEGANPSGGWEVFADGFSGLESVENPSDARYRPMGLAVGPDGSLYISDSQKGRIWRVIYTG